VLERRRRDTAPGLKAFSGVRVDAYENRIPIHYIKGHPFWVGRVILAIGSQTRNRFHPYSSRSTRVSKVFKECDFGECTGKEIYPKALTLPVDTLGGTSLRHPRKVRARKGWND